MKPVRICCYLRHERAAELGVPRWGALHVEPTVDRVMVVSAER